jgi:hypothetical protein
MKASLPLLLAAACLLAPAAHAQGLRAVRPLDGYACMNLAVPEAMLMDRSWAGVPIRSTPSADAPQAAVATPTVIAKAPAVIVNGFAQVLRLNGATGWIEAAKLKPYSSASDPYARCTPSLMSNGRPGIG